jgi:hypothetical protein
MQSLITDDFKKRMDQFGIASETSDPDVVAALFAEDAVYQETSWSSSTKPACEAAFGNGGTGKLLRSPTMLVMRRDKPQRAPSTLRIRKTSWRLCPSWFLFKKRSNDGSSRQVAGS